MGASALYVVVVCVIKDMTHVIRVKVMILMFMNEREDNGTTSNTS